MTKIEIPKISDFPSLGLCDRFAKVLHVELLIILLLTCKVYVRTVTEVGLAGAVLHYK